MIAEQVVERSNNDVECWQDHFFFQAEDGIRVTSVTGVQTCALPIWILKGGAVAAIRQDPRVDVGDDLPEEQPRQDRSEERRVGKECRTTRLLCHHKKKKRCYSIAVGETDCVA